MIQTDSWFVPLQIVNFAYRLLTVMKNSEILEWLRGLTGLTQEDSDLNLHITLYFYGFWHSRKLQNKISKQTSTG